jgi:glycosyltransferase involved in cell wall biosynthesis
VIADVDVVIPVRNGGRLLRQAIDSVLAQQGVRLRAIVVDDGSTDRAVDRLPRDPRLTVIRGRRQGIPAALNAGSTAGNAPFIARQDADDESLPGRIQAQVEHLAAHEGIGLVATGFEVVVGDRTIATMMPLPGGMLRKNPICAGSTLLRRHIFDAVGGYRPQFALASDYDMWLRCAAQTGVAILPIVGYRYRLSAGMSTIRSAARQARFAQLAQASARAHLTGAPDPVTDETEIGSPGRDDVELNAWWAREFLALGARTDALRCAARLPPRRWLRLLPLIIWRPAPQVAWS